MNRPSVAGFCAGSRQIILYAYPENDWIQRLPWALTHEYHHSVWTYNKTQQDKFYVNKIDLLSHMIMEGMAESFVEIAFTDVPPRAHTTALTVEQETEQWKSMQPLLNET